MEGTPPDAPPDAQACAARLDAVHLEQDGASASPAPPHQAKGLIFDAPKPDSRSSDPPSAQPPASSPPGILSRLYHEAPDLLLQCVLAWYSTLKQTQVQNLCGGLNVMLLANRRLRHIALTAAARLVWPHKDQRSIMERMSDPDPRSQSAPEALPPRLSELCPNLVTLDVSYNRRLRSLEGAPASLESVSCQACGPLTDISPLAACTGLSVLKCGATGITAGFTDLRVLQHCTRLQFLRCVSCVLTHLPPPGALTQLTYLDISYTRVADLSSLALCAELQFFSCEGCPVPDLAPLSHCQRLETFICSDCPISGLGPLASCGQLQVLQCIEMWNPISLAPLKACTRLKQVTCDSKLQRNGEVAELKAALPGVEIDCSHD